MAPTCDTGASGATYAAVPLAGLVAPDELPFPLYLRTSSRAWVLYKPEGTLLDESHLGRLRAEGVRSLFIQDEHRAAYARRVEAELASILLDRAVPLPRRADVFMEVAAVVADELLSAPLCVEAVARAQRLLMCASGLMLRDPGAFQAVRRVLRAGEGLARHSLTVALLSMGLAQTALGVDAASLAGVGLAGLLHDVADADAGSRDAAPADRAARSADQLGALGLSDLVVGAVRHHHHDPASPPADAPEDVVAVAAVIGVVDLFEEAYTEGAPRGGVFDALRVLAQAHRGRYDERLAAALVRLFC
ncbi:MAG: hypothetical protein ACON4Z_10760 [Planctomycetota bacterium]